jgi:hypothetical protein
LLLILSRLCFRVVDWAERFPVCVSLGSHASLGSKFLVLELT